MKALRFSESKGLRVETIPKPIPAENEALIKVKRAGICSTDLEIIRGYVPGFDHVLGHEFVGVIEECPADPSLIGKRCCGEINCPCEPCNHKDPIFRRNHAPIRKVLGIINKDGILAEYVTLPVENLHLVPDDITDQEAAFCEPLAAACRILEQHVISRDDTVAVIGDGKLGLLIAHVLSVNNEYKVSFFGRHQHKLDMVEKCIDRILVNDNTSCDYAGKFDVVVEASGSPIGIKTALSLCRSLGTLVLKSTCSSVGEMSTKWSDIANDIVVNEKVVVGSRCGPFPPALELLRDEMTKKLVNAMVTDVFSLEDGVRGIERAQQKGVIKIQIAV